MKEGIVIKFGTFICLHPDSYTAFTLSDVLTVLRNANKKAGKIQKH